MNYFTHCKNLDELKAEYRRLAKQNHPDLGGSTEEMQRINAAYAEAFDRLQKQHNASHDEWHQSTEAPEDFINIINELMKLDGLEVELCGSWLWTAPGSPFTPAPFESLITNIKAADQPNGRPAAICQQKPNRSPAQRVRFGKENNTIGRSDAACGG